MAVTRAGAPSSDGDVAPLKPRVGRLNSTEFSLGVTAASQTEVDELLR